MSEKLAYQTLVGIYRFCEFFIEEENSKSQILQHIKEIFNKWDESWVIIQQWLKEIEFSNKDFVLLNFLSKIPQLKHFASLITKLINFQPTFWETVFENLSDCKNMLK